MPIRMYFLGVTTGASSIQRIFPHWARLVGAPDAVLKGIDIPVGAAPSVYREVTARVKADPDCRGALVTTHKVAVYRHAGDLFDAFDDDAAGLGEISCIIRRAGRLRGLAIDPIASELSLRALLRGETFSGDALVMGAGGAGVAVAVVLRRWHQPKRVILTDVSAERLEEVGSLVEAERIQVGDIADHDRLIAALPPGSLIVNATGLGKDRPGSPVTPAVRFPSRSIAWDLNYRGDLKLLDLARQAGVEAVDGWECFLHGWSQVMSRVFEFEVTLELFAQMRAVAERERG